MRDRALYCRAGSNLQSSLHEPYSQPVDNQQNHRRRFKDREQVQMEQEASHEPLVGRGILTEPLGFIRLMPIGSLRTVRPTFPRFKGREQVQMEQGASHEPRSSRREEALTFERNMK